jgi:hypothetical protein
MLKSVRRFVVAAAFASMGAVASANAAPILVDPWQSSGNGTILNDNFGTVPNLDLLYSGKGGFGAGPNTSRLFVWADWGTLDHVSYTDAPVTDVFIRPDAGWLDGVSLHSIDIGSYFGAAESGEVRVYNSDYSSLLFQRTYSLGSSPLTISPQISSLDGLRLQISSTHSLVAIDNILVEGGAVFSTAVPEPATWAVVILGFGCVGAAMRHRRQRFAAQAV